MANPTMNAIGKRGGDFVIHRESLQFNMESSIVSYTGLLGPINLSQVAGYPLIGTRLALDADVAAITGFLVHGPIWNNVATTDTSPTASPYSYVTDTMGLVLNEDAVVITDVEGVAFTGGLAAIKANFSNVKWVSLSAKISTQET